MSNEPREFWIVETKYKFSKVVMEHIHNTRRQAEIGKVKILTSWKDIKSVEIIHVIEVRDE